MHATSSYSAARIATAPLFTAPLFTAAWFTAAWFTAGCQCDAPARGGDAGSVDSIDAGTPIGIDAGLRADAGCVALQCGEIEQCFDGVDNDCDGMVDDGCGCAVGTTARCLPPGRPSTGSLCDWGEMRCEDSGEFGSWGECSGGVSGPDDTDSAYGCRRIGIMGAPGELPSADFQAWLEGQGAIASRFHDRADAPALVRAELETFDLVIIDWLQRVYTLEEATTLATWVREGGALLAMSGHDSGGTADRHVSLLQALGPNYDLAAGAIWGPATLLPHPATGIDSSAGSLPSVTFQGGLRVRVPDELATQITPMAMIGDQVVGAAGPLEDGHVLIFGDEWIEFDSEWATMPPIVQFWLDAVQWLSPSESLPICVE